MRCRPPRPPTQTLALRHHRLLARSNAPKRGRTAPRVATSPPCVQHRHTPLLHQCMMQSLMHVLSTTAPVLCLAAHRRRTRAHAPHLSAYAARLRLRTLHFRTACRINSFLYLFLPSNMPLWMHHSLPVWILHADVHAIVSRMLRASTNHPRLQPRAPPRPRIHRRGDTLCSHLLCVVLHLMHLPQSALLLHANAYDMHLRARLP